MTESELREHLEAVVSELEASGEDGAAQYLRSLIRIGGPAAALRIALSGAKMGEGK